MPRPIQEAEAHWAHGPSNSVAANNRMTSLINRFAPVWPHGHDRPALEMLFQWLGPFSK